MGSSSRSLRYQRGAYAPVSQQDATVDTIGIPNPKHGDGPTAHERITLRRVPDALPWTVFLVAIVELCERFAYYGLSGPFNNYINYSYHDPTGLPGALGFGQSGATALTNFFQFWCYLTPIIGAVVADQYLGKYKTLYYFSLIYMGGICVLFVSSLPWFIEHGFAFLGLIISMVVIGLGTGGIKANVAPLIAEQYTQAEPFVRIRANGEKVIVDPGLTVQRIYMLFYLMVNIGSMSPIFTTPLEKYVGFWAAYLLPLGMFIVGFMLLVKGRKSYVDKPPTGSVVVDSFKAIGIAIKHRSIEAAKPSRHAGLDVNWDDGFVDELKRALMACKVFLFFPIYWLCFNQMMNNFISQAGQMDLHSIPNDMLGNLDPLTIIIFIPVCDRLLYPYLRRHGIAFKPMTRIFWGFLLAAAGMAYAAFVQHLIYTSPPCYIAPHDCPAAMMPNGQTKPNSVHVIVQAPAYLFVGLSEIFAIVTGNEYAYTKAPESMKSFIMALFLLTSAIGAALGGLIAPFARDPHLVTMYDGLAIATLGAGLAFWFTFRKLNDLEGIESHKPEALEMGRLGRSMEDQDEEALETEALKGRMSFESLK